MSESPAAKPRGGVLTWALWGAALIGVAAVLYITVKSSTKPTPEIHSGPVAEAPPAKTVMEKLEHPADGQPGPDFAFVDAGGKTLKAADFKGKVVVLNLWATWCGPCKIEMPTLARLQAEYAGKPVQVVAVSIDKPDKLDEAKAFIAAHAPLKFYNDPSSKAPFLLKPEAAGMPTTLILGKDGLERGRVSGDADWAGPEAKAVIDRVLAEG
jgi:thiol-disulfide isomerase/thioredoxin